MKKVTKAELDKIRLLIEAATKKRRQMKEVLKGGTNPQCMEVYARSDGMVDAFESVLEALNGDSGALSIWARED